MYLIGPPVTSVLPASCPPPLWLFASSPPPLPRIDRAFASSPSPILRWSLSRHSQGTCTISSLPSPPDRHSAERMAGAVLRHCTVTRDLGAASRLGRGCPVALHEALNRIGSCVRGELMGACHARLSSHLWPRNACARSGRGLARPCRVRRSQGEAVSMFGVAQGEAVT